MTSASDPIVRFLDIGDSAFDCLDRHRDLLLDDTAGFARSFYDYLLSHPETESILRALPPERLAALLNKQAAHFEHLLYTRFGDAYQEEVARIGRIHYRLGIAPTWITGSYYLYWDHLSRRIDRSSALTPAEREQLHDTVAKALFADLCLQLQGYASAQQEDDQTRAAVTHVLIKLLLEGRSDGNWPGLLQQMCQSLVSPQTQLLTAWSAKLQAAQHTLRVTCAMGSDGEGLVIPRADADPCWQALATRRPVVFQASPDAPLHWVAVLARQGVREIAVFPFGDAQWGYTGVGILGSTSPTYFERVGLGYFEAFSSLGDLVLGMRDQSLRDALTGLPNRVLFMDRLNHSVAGADRRDTFLAVVMLDLDGFKAINDRYGHSAGDALLAQVATRLSTVLRPQDTLARLGGDEFGLLVDGLGSLFAMEALCERFLDVFREPFALEGGLMANISASLGFTLYPLDESDPETLLRHADLAMYKAKNLGRDRFSVYSVAMSQEFERYHRLTRELSQGLQQDELYLLYQPQVDMSTGDIVGVEALLRWRHPQRGLLAPGEFLMAIETLPMSRHVGRYVLDQVLGQVRRWHAEGLRLRVAVNIGALHLLAQEFLGDVKEALEKHAFPAEFLEIEVTETTAIEDMARARQQLSACRDLGITVALDDFGTGRAPLSYLQGLPADTVKIDRTFVQNILEDPRDAAIVAGVITSARLLGLEVVAEGVENVAHGCLLLQLGCRRAQGYAVARPIAAEEMMAWVQGYEADAEWKGWQYQNWRPEDYGLLITTLGYAQLVRETRAALADPRATVSMPLLEASAEKNCVLGNWLRGEGADRYSGHVRYGVVQSLHHQLHEVAREATRLKVLGRQDEANAHIMEINILAEAIQSEFREWMEERSRPWKFES